MIRSERVIAYDLQVGGEVLPAGTKIADLSGRDWLTSAWLNDAQACGHVIKVQVEDQAASAVQAEPQADPLAQTMRLVQDDPDGGLESDPAGEAGVNDEAGAGAGEGAGEGPDGDSAGGAGDEPELPEPQIQAGKNKRKK